MRMRELIDAVMASTALSRIEADDAVSAMVEHMSNALAREESVSLPGFGKFELRHRAARNGRNPASGEMILIPARNTVAFKAGKALKEKLANGSDA